MDSADREVLDAACAWLAAGERVVLATVVRTFGSSPRPPGAWLALRGDGTLVGSVSGGCVEEDLILGLRAGRFDGPKPFLLSYGVSRDEAVRFGLPCGGSLDLVIEPRPDRAVLDELRRRLDEGRTLRRIVDLRHGVSWLEAGAAQDPLRFDGDTVIAPHGPRARLLIIGAGQISRFLAQMALALDYAVTVCDPREEYAGSWAVAGATMSGLMPDDAVTAMKPDGSSAIVALSHDPKLDDLALLEALKSPAFYVGAVGSRANQEKRRQRLGLFDLDEAQIGRLHGPVGLAIGSRLPAEIAIAILAEMIAIRNGVATADRDIRR